VKKLKFNKGFLKDVLTKYAFIAVLVVLMGVTVKVASGAGSNAESADCDSNAIVYCGVTQGNLLSKYNALDAKGKAAFAHAGVVPAQLNQTVVCSVTSDNKAIVNGQVVATNVYTYGRSYMPGSTQIPGGAYMRHPSVSFQSPSITSYCHMDGQEFKWAVISSCGNPVKGTPTHTNNPKLSIVKTASKTNVSPGEKFDYTITVRNTGNVVLRNLVIADVLPDGLEPVGLNAGVTYNPSTRRITWPAIPQLAVGGSLQKVFKVKVDADAAGRKVNIACVITSVNPNAPLCDDVPVVINRPKVRIVKDVSVTAPVDVNQEFTYTINVTNTGNIKLTNLVITDNLPDGIIDVAHPNSRTVTFLIPNLNVGESKTKSFRAKALDSAPVGTKLKNVACIDTDQTDELICDDADVEVKHPFFSCDSLGIATVDDDQRLPFRVNFTAQATAGNGAVIQGYIWNFGDGQSTETVTNSLNHDYTQSGSFTATVRVKTNKGITPINDRCSVRVDVPEEPQEPVYTCDLLTATKISDNTFRFAVNYTAQNGATLKNFTYNYGDGKSDTFTTNPVDHTYDAPGTYNVSVSVTFMVNGEEKTVTSNSCKKTVTVNNQQEPVYTCDSLAVTHLGGLQYKFMVNASASNGATIKSYSVAYGDTNSDTSVSSNVFTHTYAQPGKYNAQATVVFMVNGEEKTVSGSSCAAVVDTEKPQNCTIPGKEHLPKDSPLCKPETPKCTIPGKTDLPADSPECSTPPVVTTNTTTTLPDTGIGDIFGLLMATTVAGAAAHRVFAIRRSLGL